LGQHTLKLAGSLDGKSLEWRKTMEKFLEDQNDVISAERWRAWEAKGKRHDEAIARKIKLLAVALIGLLALAGAFQFFVAK
jgi:hypothetical protein